MKWLRPSKGARVPERLHIGYLALSLACSWQCSPASTWAASAPGATGTPETAQRCRRHRFRTSLDAVRHPGSPQPLLKWFPRAGCRREVANSPRRERRANAARTGVGEADSFGKETLARIRRSVAADYVVVGSYLLLGQTLRVDLRLQDARAARPSLPCPTVESKPTCLSSSPERAPVFAKC